MKHLRYLSVGDAFVERISPQSVFSCYSLQYLILRLNGYYHMELHGIGNLINLEFFRLYNWEIPLQLPESVGLLKKLRVLEIMGGTEKLELPECIGNLVELHRIVIRGNTLKELPDSICRLTNLKELIIQTSLKALPKDFGNVTNLQFFFLEYLLCHIPRNFGKLIPSCTMNVLNLMPQPDSSHGAVGWLKNLNDIKGALLISDIQNITSIDNVRNANLISMHNLETLLLIWDKKGDWISSLLLHPVAFWNVLPDHLKVSEEYLLKMGILGISIGYSKNCKRLKMKDHEIFENFQPHRNLKNLQIICYHGQEFPRWLGDPLSCSSLVNNWIRSCSRITSFPLGNLLFLKHLYIEYCSSLLHLKRESLPSLLKHLTIRYCNSLVEVALFESLVELEISGCNMLESLLTVHLKILETASESSEFASDYCHFKPSNELKRFPSLKKIAIELCPCLVLRANQLVLVEDCEVYIYHCENLKDWCREHNYTDMHFDRRRNGEVRTGEEATR